MVWCILLPSGDLAPGEKHGSETSMFDAAGCAIQSIELVLVRDGCATSKKDRNMEDIKFECHISHISSCYYFKSYSFILISFRIIIDFHTVSYRNNIRIFSFLILRFYHIHCLQVFSHPQINLQTRQQGCECHGRACQVHFYPSKAMAEARDAADMPGLHLKLFKLHRNLGRCFQHVFGRFVDLFWRFYLTELSEDVLRRLMKMILMIEICE